MKRVAITCGAVAVALTCVAPKQAAAGDNFVPGLVGGLALGTLFGVAAAIAHIRSRLALHFDSWSKADVFPRESIGYGLELWPWQARQRHR
jgi:hypothetical protein